MKKKNIASWIISTTIKSVLWAIVLTLLVGYIVGFRASLVVGSSSEPQIAKYSLVLDYHCSYNDLKVGDYITFKTSESGKVQYTTHQIVYIKPQGEYITPGEVVQFEHCGMKFERTINTKCQILTMLTNPQQIATVKQDYDEWKALPENQGDDAYYSQGPLCDVVNYSQVMGKVIYSSLNIGKFVFFVRNNFMQITFYVIIFYVGTLLTKFETDYDKSF